MNPKTLEQHETKIKVILFYFSKITRQGTPQINKFTLKIHNSSASNQTRYLYITKGPTKENKAYPDEQKSNNEIKEIDEKM